MTTQTQTLADFLLARIAEDEWVANTASDVRGGHLLDHDIVNFGDQRLEIAKARVLAECEAKRRIVRLGTAPYLYSDMAKTVHGVSVAPILRALALPYADHPDFREEWRP